MKYTRWVIIILAALFTGCGNSVGEPSENPNYFPIAEGDWWEYAYTGTRVAPDTLLWEQGSTFRRVISVSGDTCQVERETSTWMRFGELLPDTQVAYDTLTYVSTPDSVISIMSNGNYIKYLDLPLSPGKNWSDWSGDWTVISTDETIVTKAGTFTECALVTTPDELFNTDTCFEYCPGVGLVRDYQLYRQQTGSDQAHDLIFSLTGSSYL